MKKQLFLSLGILIFLTLGTVGVILYGKGYRFGFDKTNGSFVVGTGLLVATSTPDGAQVFINGHLSTATDNTINLAPGQYDVKIVKDGYFSWEKKITVKQEVVSKADATLFPIAPKLESISDTGVMNPVIDPSYTQIAYDVASQSASAQNGVYVLDTSNRSILTLQSNSTQIVSDSLGIPFSTATLKWSPNGQQILATIPPSNGSTQTLYLLNASGNNTAPQDVTETFATTIKPLWDQELAEKQKAQINTLKPTLAKFATLNWKNIIWSADETRILYQASSSATIPQIIKPAMIGTDSAPEQRTLQENAYYVYDTKEDKNFMVAPAPSTDEENKLTWLPDSKHIMYVHDKRIIVMDYDGLNQIIVYAGPFIDSSVFPWSDPTKILILTNLNNPQILPNLYTIEL